MKLFKRDFSIALQRKLQRDTPASWEIKESHSGLIHLPLSFIWAVSDVPVIGVLLFLRQQTNTTIIGEKICRLVVDERKLQSKSQV